jgi:hypothetical protein
MNKWGERILIMVFVAAALVSCGVNLWGLVR